GLSQAVFHADGDTYYRGNNGDDGHRWSHLGFVVRLPCHADSVMHAKELMVPNQVTEAEADGLEVVRQGEWFFIPREDSPRGVLRKPLQEARSHEGRVSETKRWGQQYQDPDLGSH
ncbi:MAG: hypothetical protein GWN18_16995, partial [Thermoplasmata archaeon]|nr:hypothetical protein [Thermoplasmata archaeon]NIT79189.1 hypothetical protein [Thermoplasmata archaeon]NIU50686.1 hypothetical protein [Thermoplasmata archaeon]NIV80410.1 hypothetical protein [Thermoplasmata archaeon]NIW84214.1 hypothetical protein [Thermoplasmata archaeon]